MTEVQKEPVVEEQQEEPPKVESSGETVSTEKFEKPKIKEEEINYDIVEQPKYTATRALFVGNLTSTFENSELQNMLEHNVKDSGCTIERAWLNQKRTHSIVVVSEIDGAKMLRDKLNGKLFPNIETGEEQKEHNNTEMTDQKEENGEKILQKPLFIDFIPVKVVQTWIDQEDDGPPDAIWKIEYEKIRDLVIAQHRMINYTNVEHKSRKFFDDKRSRDYRRYNNGYHDRGYKSDRGRYYRSREGESRRSYPGADYYNSRSHEGKIPLYSSSYVPREPSSDFRGRSYDRYYDRGGPYRSSSRRMDSYSSGGYSGRSGDRYYDGGYNSGGSYRGRRGDYGSSRGDYGGRYSSRGRNGYQQDRQGGHGAVDKEMQSLLLLSARTGLNNYNADDRDRSRSPVRPSDMEWDLEGDN